MMPPGRTTVGGSSAPGRNADGPRDSARPGRSVGSSDDPTGNGGSIIERTDSPTESSTRESSDSSGAGGFEEIPLEAELELPPVEIHPWGGHALAIVLREGARVVDVRSALRFLPKDAALEGVYGDVEFAVAFEIPHGTES
jgi:uncharacterized repeat protein (TIGR03917 family)